jgi:hypothetical protein
MVLFALLMLLVLFLFYSLVLLPLELTLRLLVSGLFSVYSLNNSISRSSFTNPALYKTRSPQKCSIPQATTLA